jgi:GAF domain-containing protein
MEINILQALASYVAVSLANANSYQIVKDTHDILEIKNQNITDSIRYAQTIQQTILPSSKEFIINDLTQFLFFCLSGRTKCMIESVQFITFKG